MVFQNSYIFMALFLGAQNGVVWNPQVPRNPVWERVLCSMHDCRLLSRTVDIFRFFMNKGKEVTFVENIAIRWWSSCRSLHHVIFKCSDVSDNRTTYFAGCLNFGRNVIFFFYFEDQLLGHQVEKFRHTDDGCRIFCEAPVMKSCYTVCKPKRWSSFAQ